MAHVGQAIRARREELGWTQDELCIRLGWSIERRGDISRIERGRWANLKINRLLVFAHALKTTASDLVLGMSTDLDGGSDTPEATQEPL